jgi:hypothetical protein
MNVIFEKLLVLLFFSLKVRNETDICRHSIFRHRVIGFVYWANEVDSEISTKAFTM